MNSLIILLIPALIQVESGGRADAIGDGGKAAGVLQIHKAYWEDGCKAAGVNWPYSWAKKPDKAKVVAGAYLKKYGKLYEQKTGKKATMEVLARIHNGGLNGYRYKSTIKYWEKVRKELKK
jgi:hypothetical protein